MSAKILIVDDEADIRSLLKIILSRAGCQIAEAATGAELHARFDAPELAPDLVLLDLKLPDADGMDLLADIRNRWPKTMIVMLTGHGSLDTAVRAIKLGAYDFQQKPFDPKTLVVSIERALENKQLREEAQQLRKPVTSLKGAAPTIASPLMKDVTKKIEKVAPSDVPVLITGESGTGKEVIADLCHALSKFSEGPLVKVNCPALPTDQIEAELFGAAAGIGGVENARAGLFEQANGGTILLDEISEMPVELQSKLLRVLQDMKANRVGSEETYDINCRIVSTTNQDPTKAITENKLREDLYYRINAVTITIPPLRQRKEDVMPLAKEFLKRYAAQADRTIGGFSSSAEDRLKSFDWPGNVRQLQNIIQQAVLLSEGALLELDDLGITGEADDENDAKVDKLTLMQGMERNTIIQVLKETGGNKLETARRLGIGRQTLYNKIKSYQITV